MTRKWTKRLFAVSLCIVLCACMAGVGLGEVKNEIPLPVTEEPITITLYGPISGDATAYGFYDNLGDTPTAKRFMELTGVNIEYSHPPRGQESEQFNLLIASDEIPDVISGFFASYYRGGVAQAIEDGLVQDIEEQVLEYAPNFRRAVLEDPDARKLAYNDEGKLIGFGAFYSLEWRPGEGLPYVGLFIRQDLLDAVGREMPVTIDDWTETLRAFKEYGVKVPLAYTASGGDTMRSSHVFANAFDTGANGFYQIDGKAYYSPIQPGFKDFLALLHQWYEEGLISPDFVTQNNTDHAMSMFVEGEAAVLPLHIYTYNNIVSAIDERGYTVVPAPFPVREEGQELHITHDYGFFGGKDLVKSITYNNKYVKETIMAFDYLYSDEGKRLTNWGIEGESYVLDSDGQPMLTEELINDLYRLNVVYCPNELNQICDKVHDLVQYPLEQQKQAHILWRTGVDGSWTYPTGISYTAEESTRRAELLTEIGTYASEMYYKFILGDRSLDEFDSYVEQIKKMGIEEIYEIDEAVMARYAER